MGMISCYDFGILTKPFSSCDSRQGADPSVTGESGDFTKNHGHFWVDTGNLSSVVLTIYDSGDAVAPVADEETE